MVAEDVKACSVCGVVKPYSDYSYDKRRATGRQARCLACQREWQHRYRVEHPEAVKVAKRTDYERHKGRVTEGAKRWAAEHPERVKAARLDNYRRNVERFREKQRRYSEANRQVCNARIKSWGLRNKDKLRDYAQRRRAVVRGADVERIATTAVGNRDGWICGICHYPVGRTVPFRHPSYPSVDHILPLSMGGPHTLDNVRIAHMACNVRRGAARGEEHGRAIAA